MFAPPWGCEFHNFCRGISANHNHVLSFSVECPVVQKIFFLICTNFYPNLWSLEGGVMNFTINIVLPLQMQHTKGQDNPSTCREEPENVKMLMHSARQKRITIGHPSNSELTRN